MERIKDLGKYYTYTFKLNDDMSYCCSTSKIYKKKYILGHHNHLYVPLDLWFCKNMGLALPIGYIDGHPFDLRQQLQQQQQYIPIQISINF